MSQSRIIVILHPNTTRIDLVLNDRLFNKERYSFSRKQEPEGAEASLLDALNHEIIGVESAETSKNTLSLNISEGMYESEFMPQVISAVKAFGGDGYEPSVFCENRRYEVSPNYSEDGYTTSEGVRVGAGVVDLGFPYEVWNAR